MPPSPLFPDGIAESTDRGRDAQNARRRQACLPLAPELLALHAAMKTRSKPTARRACPGDHPSSSNQSCRRPAVGRARKLAAEIPANAAETELDLGGRRVRLTNLQKLFWKSLNITKGELLAYYATIGRVLLPHLQNRAMVMKRYPQGAAGPFFFMKRTPTPHPDWLCTCTIDHASGNRIEFPVVDDLAALLWIVNLGCIDLNPWYARCDDVDRPDYLHFDLDPGPGASFSHVCETALLVRDGLAALGMKSLAKTTGSRGVHIYVAIKRGPTQKQVWTFAKQFAQHLAELKPKLITAEYRIATRPRGRVLVDYNQNAWGRTLASVYSVRPTPQATVSAPVGWDELERGIEIEDFTLRNMPQRIAKVGDLWRPLLSTRARFRLEKLL
jgi:bifunctional non-homologous end joining protein LigD